MADMFAKSNWTHIDEVGGDTEQYDWWCKAYEIFLENNPVPTIESHVLKHLTKDSHDDHGFTIKTEIPVEGMFIRGVDPRAVLLVIARNKQMQMNEWNNLMPRDPTEERPVELTENEKRLINCTIQLLYGKHAMFTADFLEMFYKKIED